MKVCVIQPHYSVCYEDSPSCFFEEMQMLDQCDQMVDVIVCPEMCDVPVLVRMCRNHPVGADCSKGLAV